nr:MAG TPA: hypothetical protein [Caudoviricetes sp.]
MVAGSDDAISPAERPRGDAADGRAGARLAGA